METTRMYNEEWNHLGILKKRITMDVTIAPDGAVSFVTILTELF